MIKKSSREMVGLHSSEKKNGASEPEIRGTPESDPPQIPKREQYAIQLHRPERAHLDGPPVNANLTYTRNPTYFATESLNHGTSPLRGSTQEYSRASPPPGDHRSTEGGLDGSASRQGQVLSYIDTEK